MDRETWSTKACLITVGTYCECTPYTYLKLPRVSFDLIQKSFWTFSAQVGFKVLVSPLLAVKLKNSHKFRFYCFNLDPLTHIFSKFSSFENFYSTNLIMVHLEPVFYILVSSSIGVPAVFFINKMKYVCFWEHTLYTLEIECSSHITCNATHVENGWTRLYSKWNFDRH